MSARLQTIKSTHGATATNRNANVNGGIENSTCVGMTAGADGCIGAGAGTGVGADLGADVGAQRDAMRCR